MDSSIETHIPAGTLPLVAILRGVTPETIESVAGTLIEAGIRIIEVTLNTPHALQSIEKLIKKQGSNAIIGAGTVLDTVSVTQVRDLGGMFIVSPNTHAPVITETKKLGMASIPGAFTPTEVFEALRLGADIVKIFPCVLMKPQGIRNLKAILPPDTRLLPTGGVNIPQGISYESDGTVRPQPDEKEDILAYLQTGCWGVGLGNNLYNPKMSLPEIARQAKLAVQAVKEQLKSSKK